MDGRKHLLFALALGLCSGCHNQPAPEFPNWAGHVVDAASAERDYGGFDYYARAAEEAERNGGRYLDMVSFYPGQRRRAEELTARALITLAQGTLRRSEFEFQPTPPFAPPPHQQGWRLLGRDLVWKVQEAVLAQNYEAGIRAAITATKFGLDISAGGAMDASLGFAIANEARQAIAPAMEHMNARQLGELAAGMKQALETKPDLANTIDHEHENMLLAVQMVQDAYRASDYSGIKRNLGVDASSAIEFLQGLHHKDATKRPEYFNGLAAEADADAEWMKTLAALPVARRSEISEPKFKADRPWRRFAKHFFSSLEPLLEMNDATLARTRLLIAEAWVLGQVKSTGAAPKDLSRLPQELTTDPYSGAPFPYAADGADYHLYSVGADLKDDGGDTDETYSQPDLKLEKGS